MKKTIYVLALAASLFAIASCDKPNGGKGDKNKPVELTVTTSGYNFTEEFQPVMVEFTDDELPRRLELEALGDGVFKTTLPTTQSTLYHYMIGAPEDMASYSYVENAPVLYLTVSATQQYTASGVAPRIATCYASAANKEERPSELNMKLSQFGCNLRIALKNMAAGETVKSVNFEADKSIIGCVGVDAMKGMTDKFTFQNTQIGSSPVEGAEGSSNIWLRTLPTTINSYTIYVDTIKDGVQVNHKLYFNEPLVLLNGKTVSIEFDLEESAPKSRRNIFLIGNSFTQDACHRLPGVLVGLGIKDVEVTQCYYGGRLVSQYNAGWETSSDYTKHTALPGEDVMKNTSGANLKTVASSKDWDIVCIQEHTGNSAAWEWNATAKQNLSELMEKVAATQSKRPKFYYILSQTYFDEGKIGSASRAYITWKDQAGMYDVTVAFAKKVMEELPFDGIIATGTCLQNLRQTELNNSLCLTRDGYHMDYGVSRYAAACTCYQVMLNKYYGKNLSDCTFRISENTAGTTPVTDDNLPIIVQAAKDAAMYPYTVTYQSRNYGESGAAGSGLEKVDFGNL